VIFTVVLLFSTLFARNRVGVSGADGSVWLQHSEVAPLFSGGFQTSSQRWLVMREWYRP
jgi:hypothetical protein